jgi:hypothetical protein
MRNNFARRKDDLLRALFVTGLRRSLKGHLHVNAHFHGGYRRLIVFSAVVLQQPFPPRKLLRPHEDERAEQSEDENCRKTLCHESSDTDSLRARQRILTRAQKSLPGRGAGFKVVGETIISSKARRDEEIRITDVGVFLFSLSN